VGVRSEELPAQPDATNISRPMVAGKNTVRRAFILFLPRQRLTLPVHRAAERLGAA